MNLDRFNKNFGIAMLDSHIETLGEVGLLSLIVEKLSVGTKPSDIARSLELPFMVMWEWLEADPKRQRAYDQGWAMYANDMHAEVIEIADSATLEEVPLAKLRIDTRFKAASSYDRKRFGARTDVNVTQTHTMDIKSLLELREARLAALAAPVTDDGYLEVLPSIEQTEHLLEAEDV